MESYRAQLQAKLSQKLVQMTQTSLHKWAGTENYKPVKWNLKLVASKLNCPGTRRLEYGKVPNELSFDFPSGSKKPVCGELEYSGDNICYFFFVSKSVERKS